MQPIDWASELDRQREPLKRLARALLGDAHGAEDVVQDAFAAVLARERRPEGLASFLRAVVRKLALDRKRRGARRDAREHSVARRESVGDESDLDTVEQVTWAQRAFPLLQMLKNSRVAGAPVLWEN